MVDGSNVLPMATSQDHKRIGEGDTGPNTGGMGAYSPAPVVTPAMHERIMREVMEPTVRGLAADGAGLGFHDRTRRPCALKTGPSTTGAFYPAPAGNLGLAFIKNPLVKTPPRS